MASTWQSIGIFLSLVTIFLIILSLIVELDFVEPILIIILLISVAYFIRKLIT